MVNLHEKIKSQELDARIDVVISSRGDAVGVERARNAGLAVTVVERKALGDEEFERGITRAVGDVDLVCMAGFLSLWRIPERHRGRVVNIHPALLPEFGGKGMYGHRVHEAVLAAGKTESGCTVHFCDNEYDHGPIILQRRVRVLPGDTPDALADRVFEQECIAYPEAVRLFAQRRVKLEGKRVVVR